MDTRQRAPLGRAVASASSITSAVSNLANLVRLSVSMAVTTGAPSTETSPSKGARAGAATMSRATSASAPVGLSLSLRDDTSDEIQFAVITFNAVLRTRGAQGGGAGEPAAGRPA